MNKAELIEVLTTRMNTDRRAATEAVENLVDAIVRAVQKGDSVTITGFGVFERRRRAARVARNPRTGETVKVADFRSRIPSGCAVQGDCLRRTEDSVGGPSRQAGRRHRA